MPSFPLPQPSLPTVGSRADSFSIELQGQTLFGCRQRPLSSRAMVGGNRQQAELTINLSLKGASATEGSLAEVKVSMRSLTAACRRDGPLTAVRDDRGVWRLRSDRTVRRPEDRPPMNY